MIHLGGCCSSQAPDQDNITQKEWLLLDPSWGYPHRIGLQVKTMSSIVILMIKGCQTHLGSNYSAQSSGLRQTLFIFYDMMIIRPILDVPAAHRTPGQNEFTFMVINLSYW